MIVTLITVGKYLETRAKGKTSAAIEKLMKLAPQEATVLRGGVEMVVPVEDLAVGDEIVVRPGERIPADGVVSKGTTSVDESTLQAKAFLSKSRSATRSRRRRSIRQATFTSRPNGSATIRPSARSSVSSMKPAPAKRLSPKSPTPSPASSSRPSSPWPSPLQPCGTSPWEPTWNSPFPSAYPSWSFPAPAP